MARRSSRRPSLGPARGQVATSVNLPAPTRGLVTAVPLGEMPPDSAILMINFFPEVDGISPRGGAAYYGNSAIDAAPVESMFSFQSGSTKKLFAGAGTTIYDVTLPNSPTAAVTGLTGVHFQVVNWDGSSGPQLLVFNTLDLGRRFDGTSWSTLSYTVGGVAFNSALVACACTYNARLYLGSGSTIYYAPADSFQGALEVLQVGPEMSKGGQIIALGRWTHDAGVGTQDQLVVVTDQGEVITYQGTNPSEASAWQLTGKYQTGLPIGRNVLVKLGGDLGVLTRDGVQAMSKIVTLDRAQADSQGAFTSNIRDRYKIDAALYGSNFGWQATVFPDRNMLLVNVPFQQYTDSYQYVMNVQTGAWTRFLGWNAICFHYFNGALYFGLNAGRIGVTTTELLSTDFGIKITCRLICAFTAIGGRGRGKLVKMIRPVLWSTSTIRYACGMAFDYRLSLATVEAAAQTVGNVNGGLVLAADQILMSWSGASGYGYAIAPTLNIEFQDGDNANFSSSVRLIGFDALVEAGGVL